MHKYSLTVSVSILMHEVLDALLFTNDNTQKPSRTLKVCTECAFFLLLYAGRKMHRSILTASLFAVERGPSFDMAFSAKAARIYNDQIGRRLPMTAFQELVLNETRGKRSKHILLSLIHI